jgi:hypothetical protein
LQASPQAAHPERIQDVTTSENFQEPCGSGVLKAFAVTLLGFPKDSHGSILFSTIPSCCSTKLNQRFESWGEMLFHWGGQLNPIKAQINRLSAG